MRFPLVAALVLALVSQGAKAPAGLPRFSAEASYLAVRARLIKLGYEPVPVKAKPGLLAPCPNDGAFCRAFPEVLVCGVGGWMQFCHHLFRRRSDGRLLIVETAGEASGTDDAPDLSGVMFRRAFPPREWDLDDVIIASPARKGRR